MPGLFPSGADSPQFQLTTANTNLDGTGTIVTGLTGPNIQCWAVNFTVPGSIDEGWIAGFYYDGTNTRYIGRIEFPKLTAVLGKPPLKLSFPVPTAHQFLKSASAALKFAISITATVNGQALYKIFPSL